MSGYLLLRSDVGVDPRHLHDARIGLAKVYVKRPHGHPTSLAELLEDGRKIRRELVSQIDIVDDRGSMLVTVRPGLVVAGESRLGVALAGAVVAEERQEDSPLLPADVELAVLFLVDIARPPDCRIGLEAADFQSPPAPAVAAA
jgi:hypothetical protein